MSICRCLYASPALALVSVFGAGCQPYSAKPIDLAAHHAQWLERSVHDERVAAYADRLRDAGALEAPFDLGDGMTREEAEVVALVLNADLRTARAEAGVAAATAENAGLWTDPTLGVDVLRVLANVQHPWMTAATVGFTIPISGRLGKEKALAATEHVEALRRVSKQEWQTIITLRRAWTAWSAEEERLAIARTYFDELGGLVGIVEDMLAAGEMNRLEGRIFQIEHRSTAQDIARIEASRDRRGIELRRLMGLAPSAAVTLVPSMRIDTVAESEAVEANIIARNPSLQQMVAAYESSERALELEVRKQYPDIMVGPAHEYDDGDHRVGIGVSMPLPIFNANRLGIARARAERDRRGAALQGALEAVLTEFAAAEVEHDVAVRRRKIVEEQLVPLVDAQFADAREVARLGEVDTWLLLETLRKRFEVKQQLIMLMEEESAALIERTALIGPESIVLDSAEVKP